MQGMQPMPMPMQQQQQQQQQGTVIAMPGHCGAQAREVNGAAPTTVTETKHLGLSGADFGWEAESGKKPPEKCSPGIQEPSEIQLLPAHRSELERSNSSKRKDNGDNDEKGSVLNSKHKSMVRTQI